MFAICHIATGQAPTADQPNPLPGTSTPVAPSAFQARLNAVDDKMAKVETLRADFEQRKKTPLLKKPMVSQGGLVCKGDTVLWKTTSPRESAMLVTDASVTVLYVENGLAEVYPIGENSEGLAGGPLPRLAKLVQLFTITEARIDAMPSPHDTADPARHLAFTLTPISAELKAHVATITVLIDERIPCASLVVIADPDGDETQVRFSNVRINTPLSESELRLNLPVGTRVSHPVGEAE